MDQSRVLVLGFAFKENCRDVRNTKVFDIVTHLEKLNITVDVYDPLTDPREIKEMYGITAISEPGLGKYDAVILAVAHDEFKSMTASEIAMITHERSVVYDLKYVLPAECVTMRL